MFYDRLNMICEEKGIKMTNLIKEMGMSTGNISKWKAGNVPKSATVSALAEYLGVSTDFLLGIDVTKEKTGIILDNPELTLTADEKWFVLKLRELDKEGKTMVESTVISELRRISAEKEHTNVG